MTASAFDQVGTPCAAQREMAKSWELIDDLLGGTLAMRKAGTKWLPQEKAEDAQAYAVRLGRTTLYEMFKDTVRRLRSKPFSRPVTLDVPAPERLATIEADADGMGQDLTQFASAMFEDMTARGLTHIFVDFPNVAAAPDEDPIDRSRRITAGAERALRPTFVHVKATDILGWKLGRDGNGRPQLAEVRFKESRYEPDGEYGEKLVDYVRVLTLTDWTLYSKQVDGAWTKVGGGKLTLGVVPFLTAYSQRTGFMTAEPPLGALAWVNLSHYQSDSDQRNILRFNRFGLLFQCGVDEEEMEKAVVIGPAKLVRTKRSKADADLKVVEGTGSAIGAGRQDVQDLELRGEVLGLQPLMARSGDATATGQALDASKTQCDVQAWVRSLERTLTQAYELAAKWVGAELPEKFRVNIFNEFGLSMRATSDIEQLIKLQAAGILPKRAVLLEVRRRSLISEDSDVDQLLADVEAENPVDGMTGTEDEPAGGDPAQGDRAAA